MANHSTPASRVLVKNSVCTLITAAANNGASVDTLGYRAAMAVFTSLPTGVGTTSDCKLAESADNSTFADVASAAFAQATTAGGKVVETMNIDLAKRKRYLRLVHTGAGASAAGSAVGEILLFSGNYLPPTQDVTAVTV